MIEAKSCRIRNARPWRSRRQSSRARASDVGPPPQWRRSRPFDSRPDTLVPSGMLTRASTSPVFGSDAAEIALVALPGAVPELILEPCLPRDEAGLNRASSARGLYRGRRTPRRAMLLMARAHGSPASDALKAAAWPPKSAIEIPFRASRARLGESAIEVPFRASRARLGEPLLAVTRSPGRPRPRLDSVSTRREHSCTTTASSSTNAC
jgi:hypothetical protein